MKLDIKITPICSIISVLIIFIFLLYSTNYLKSIPCEKDMISVLTSQFIHIDFIHLVSNLIGLYALSRVEYKLGLKKFLILIVFLLIFNTIIDILLHKIIKTSCSIGFSGILYGIATFEIICSNTIDYTMFIAILSNIILTYSINKKSSLSGHLIGVFTGILGAFIFKQLPNCCN